MATLRTAEIKPGTTPLLTVTVDGQAIQDATVYVTIDMGDRHVTKTNYNDDGDLTLEPVYKGTTQTGTKVMVQYSQAETLMLRPGNAEVEVGWVFEDGSADKTNIGRLKIPKTLIWTAMAYNRIVEEEPEEDEGDNEDVE